MGILRSRLAASAFGGFLLRRTYLCADRERRLMRGGVQLTGTVTDGLAPLLLAAAIGLALAGMGPALAQGPEIVERKLPADAQPQADDVLILRDGRTERGRLMGCAADSCILGGSSVPRESIAWIGLEADDASPPGARDASADAVHLRNGSVRPGRLVGISQYEVATERGGHPRDEVAWIALEGDTPEQEVDAGPPPQEGPGVSIEPSAQDLERLRAGEEMVLRGGVRFKDLSECCVGQTFARIGAQFDVDATAEIRLIPRR